MVGKKIRDLRKRLGITQEQLAGPELTKSYVSQVELGRVRPSRKALEMMAQRLGKPLGYFLDNDDDIRTVTVLLQASEALLISRRVDEALVGLTEAQYLAERIGRDDILAQIDTTMGRLALAQSNPLKAIDHLKHALDHLSPTDDAAQIVRIAAHIGRASQEADLFHDAVTYYQISVKTARTQSNPALKVDALMEYGDFCAREHHWQSALILYQEAEAFLDTSAADTTALSVRMAVAQCHLGNFESARPAVIEGVTSWDRLPQGSVDKKCRLGRDLAECLIRLNELQQAQRILDETLTLALSQSTRDMLPDILHTVLVWCRASSDSKAISQYLDLIEHRPDSPRLDAVKADAYVLLAEHCPNLSQRVEYLGQALHCIPNDPNLLLKRAVAQAQGQDKAALRHLWTLMTESRMPEIVPLSFPR